MKDTLKPKSVPLQRDHYNPRCHLHLGEGIQWLAQMRLFWAVKTIHLQKLKKKTRFFKTEFLPYAWSTKLENHTSWKAERKVSFPQGRSLVTHEWNQKEIQLSDRKASFRKTKFVNKRVGTAGWMHPQFCYEWLGKAISLLFHLSASSSLQIMAALQVLLAVTNACKRTVRFWDPRCLRCMNADGQPHFLWRERRKGRNRLASHILTWERALNHPRDVLVSHLLGWGHWWDTSQ